MKFSKKFESDYNWFISICHLFDTDGTPYGGHINKKGKYIVQYDKDGLTAKESFYLYDSQGIIKPTFEVVKLETLLRTKGSINLHIKMYAEDRAKMYLPYYEFNLILEEINAPDWFRDAVENQKKKYL
jgi:hypothetical protein